MYNKNKLLRVKNDDFFVATMQKNEFQNKTSQNTTRRTICFTTIYKINYI